MKHSLVPGLRGELTYVVPDNKTVPHLYPESKRFREMPEVFATGFLVGLLEWCCLECMIPHLDWPAEKSVGTHIDVSHCAATVAGQTIHVNCEVTEIDRRRVVFSVIAHDGVDEISRGQHERFVIDTKTFEQSIESKRQRD